MTATVRSTNILRTDVIRTDVLVIGGGAAGLAAAVAAADEGARVLIAEQEDLGGILNQCIHNGFGLTKFREELTGPEYADRYTAMLSSRPGIKTLRGTVSSLTPELTAEIITKDGVKDVRAKAVILATGCRERAIGALTVAGTHPAGIFCAGAAQKLVNLEGRSVGKRIVILGSGDIGLIMARRFTLEGAKVEAVLEIMPAPGGLNRNISQCLHDFHIPLELSTTVVEVRGEKRVEEVVASKVDENLRPIPGTEKTIKCDTLVLSVGLLPVTNLIPFAAIDPATKGAAVDSHGMTSASGVFSCGNALHVHDLVDNVSEESARVGGCAARYALGNCSPVEKFALKAGKNVASVVPQKIIRGEETAVYVRLKKQFDGGSIVFSDETGRGVVTKKRGVMVPNETIVVKLKPEQTVMPLIVSAEES